MDLINHLKVSQDLFRAILLQVKDEQWDNSTPCKEWSVRDLANHMLSEDLWIPDLFAGKTIAEVGDKYEGDVLGENPIQNWDSAVAKTREALSDPSVLGRTVHLSYGDTEGESYLTSMLSDHVIHAWDLAKGIGVEYNPDPASVEAVWEWMSPRANMISGSSVFGPKVEVADEASLITKLLGLAGRDWNWQPPQS